MKSTRNNQAVVLDPNDAVFLSNLAQALSTSPDDKQRDGTKAVELASKACEITQWKNAEMLACLAGAYAEKREFRTAMKWQAKAIALTIPAQKPSYHARLEYYRVGKPVRLTRPRVGEVRN